MKRNFLRFVLSFTFLIFTNSAFAIVVGPYLGLGAGIGKVRTPEKYAFNVSTLPNGSTRRDLDGLAGRAFVGFNWSKCWGVEGGYSRYSKALYVGRGTGFYGSYSYYFHTFDAVLKGHLPIGDFFTVYGLGGVARIFGKLDYVNNGVPLSGAIATPPGATTRIYKTRPIYGVGVTYTAAKHFTAALEATEIPRIGSMANNIKATPALDLFTFSLAYNFC